MVTAPVSEAMDDGGRYVGHIPVRNLWLLMLYASDLFRVHGRDEVALEDDPDELPDLVGELLAHAVEQRQRRQLSLSYRSRSDVLHRVRGRIDVLATETRQLRARGRVACRFDELTIDTPRNRFVRAALGRLARIARRRDVAHRCRKLASGLKTLGVGGHPPSPAEMRADRFGRHDAEDRFMVAAARLAFDLALPTEAAGTGALPRPDRDERWVRGLFERAVGGFYAVVLTGRGWRVAPGGTRLHWPVERSTPGIDKVLPAMLTDVVLEHRPSGRRIVIDTKFTSILTRGRYREETPRSGYLYQMYAYLRSQVARGDPIADRAEGVLLHPSVGRNIDETAVIQGHAIRFATVDLAAPSATIRRQLLKVVEPPLDTPGQRSVYETATAGAVRRTPSTARS